MNHRTMKNPQLYLAIALVPLFAFEAYALFTTPWDYWLLVTVFVAGASVLLALAAGVCILACHTVSSLLKCRSPAEKLRAPRSR